MKAKVVSLEELKQMCEQFLEVCISGSDDDIRHFGEDVEVRFINDDGSFGYTYVTTEDAKGIPYAKRL